jgi:negative regulator of sigma-B (phosphoserine phosphatase)
VAEPVVDEGRSGALEWAVCVTPRQGQRRSGDGFLVESTATGVLVAVVDGLGHGDEAATVAQLALTSLRQTAGRSPTASLTACHVALRGTRGAVMTLAALDPHGGRLVWVAVGNVEAAVLRRGDNGMPNRPVRVPLRGGVVGDRLPPLRESSTPLAVGDVLVCATDGVAPAFLDAVDLSLEPPAMARRLHAGSARTDDDALVLVARLRATADRS